MQNIKTLNKKLYRIAVPELGPPKGFALKLVAGMEKQHVKPDTWLSHWQELPNSYEFGFDAKLPCCFQDTAPAERVRDLLQGQGVQTVVVKLG